MLVYCLGRFDSHNAINTLREALNDTRPIVHTWRSFESAPWPVGRVSDEAYLALLPKVQKSEGTVISSPIPPWKLPQDDNERNRRNNDLKVRLNALRY
jgi:hypothetical protein